MTVEELKDVLSIIGVPSRNYPINGDLNSDIHVLRKVSGFWEYFYIDECDGLIGVVSYFDSEAKACEDFINKLRMRKKMSELAKVIWG